MFESTEAKTNYDDVSALWGGIIELTPAKRIACEGAKVATHGAEQWQPGEPWEQELPPPPAWMKGA